MEGDHESTCQQGVLVSLHELNMVNLYWETVLFTTRHYSKRPLMPDHTTTTVIVAKPALCVPTREAGQREVMEDLPGEGGVASDTRL